MYPRALRSAWSSSKRRETNVLMCDTARFYQRHAETTPCNTFSLSGDSVDLEDIFDTLYFSTSWLEMRNG
jgi:hypothetical protein